MKAEIIAVGTEILTGQIVNTNAQFLSERCAQLGIDVFFQTAVGDNEDRLLSVIDITSQRSDVVFICGGLGPTEDDLTKQTLARYLKRDLVIDPEAMEKLDAFFASRPGRKRTANNERQAYILSDSTPLANPRGLAVGNLITQDGVTYVLLPGPPSELTAMFTHSLQPLLGQGQELYSRVLRFVGIGESQLVTVLADMIENQTDPTIAPYAKLGEVTLRLSTKSGSQEAANSKLDELEEAILQRDNLKNYLYGYGEETSLAQVVASQLEQEGLTLAILEDVKASSGRLQTNLTDSLQGLTVYTGGQIVLTDETSLQEALELAKATRDQYGAKLGLAVLGKIIDDSRADMQQVQLYLALASEQTYVTSEPVIGGHSWQDRRQIASLYALDFVRNSMKKNKDLL